MLFPLDPALYYPRNDRADLPSRGRVLTLQMRNLRYMEGRLEELLGARNYLIGEAICSYFNS